MKRFLLLLCLMTAFTTASAQQKSETEEVATDSTTRDVNITKSGRLTVGGYGEVIFNRAFYSDNYKRYSYPESYANDKGYGQIDLPHFVIFLGYDFGKGWSFTSEIEFEHGGVGSAIEIDPHIDSWPLDQSALDNLLSNETIMSGFYDLARALVYGDVMKSAGDAGNSLYKSQKSAMSEILNGIITIVDEVGNTKIQDPIDSGNPFDVESWFSYNSIIDFTDNVKGCQMAYAEISDYIQSLDTDVDADIATKFDKAILEVGGESGEGNGSGMVAPFRDNVGSGSATTDQQEAIDACNALMAAVEAADELVNAQSLVLRLN